MASIINALSSGTGGIVTAGDASGILQLQTANTAALTVNTNGSLTVSSTGSGITYASSGGSGLRMYGAAGTNQWDVYGNGANIRFSDNTGGGIVVVDTAARIGSTIGVGATTPSSSGAGITFPATQSASSDANTLDDYEEGTWSPVMSFGGNSVGITYTAQQGAYVKVGQLVHVQLYVNLSASGSSTGAAAILNLPFASTGTAYAGSAVSHWGSVSGVTFFGCYMPPGSAYINLSGGNPAPSTNSSLSNTNFSAGSYFIFSLTYRASA